MIVKSSTMNDMIVPNSSEMTPADVLDTLANALEGLSRELTKAAVYLIENPNEIGISSIRMIADAAGVKPNTLVRLARSVGFEGYEDFRRPFQEEIRQGRDSFPDRASWLQTLGHGGKLHKVYANMASDAIRNIEALFADSDAVEMQAAARAIVKAPRTFVLGVGIANAYARTFSYLAGMGIGGVSAIPAPGSLPVDGLLQAGKGDVLLAMTFQPYRREVVEAVETAHELGMEVIGVSDSLASPILSKAAHRFVISTRTPQFFTSTVALAAFLETLIAFVVAEADHKAVANIERFHQRRQALGIYHSDEGDT